MTEHHDYMPQKEAELAVWVDRFLAEITTNAAAWEIPQTEVTTITEKNNAFKLLYTRCAGTDRTSVLVAEKKVAKAALRSAIRAMVSFRFANPVITDAMRVKAGLRPRDRARTPVKKPETRSNITDIKSLNGFKIEIRFQDEAAPDSRAIPYGDNGCLLYYTWGAEKITDYTLLTQTALMTRSPWRFSLPPEAESRYLSCATRRQNRRGELGPWSEIRHTVIS